MLRKTTLLLVLGGLAAFASPLAMGQTCDANSNTFTNLVDDRWTTAANWSRGHMPTSNEVACIPAGMHAVADRMDLGDPGPAHLSCLAVIIERDGEVWGTVAIDYGRSLTIREHSRVDGRFVLIGVLKIDGDLTIAGAEGLFHAGGHGGGGGGIVSTQTNPLYTLTLQGDDNSDPTTSLSLRGVLDVQVPVVNNAFVVGDFDGGEYAMTMHEEVSGNGHWMADAQFDGGGYGRLVFKKQITGSADFSVIGDRPEASIEIAAGAASTTLTGDVTIDTGTFIVNDDFTTTGNLTMESVGGLAPVIEVAARVTLRFENP